MDTTKIFLLIILTCYYADASLFSGKKNKEKISGKQVTIYGTLMCPGYHNMVVVARLRQPNVAQKVAKKLVGKAKSTMILGKVLDQETVHTDYHKDSDDDDDDGRILSANVPPKLTKIHIELKPIRNKHYPACKHIIEAEIPFKDVKTVYELPNGHHDYEINLGTCNFAHGTCDALSEYGIRHKPKTQAPVGGPKTRENIDSYEPWR
ncbi:hypothetical protein DdX_16782 [Ditylenchus destructor]|uniref:Uncharacterized protein n=1 Tax=Ditylenchus destructor TaxID=166010 RepID=A0AAD4MMH9_9BILA|nr:hypothetical protein DdX_16782 [Ditylenchus destructor]